MNKLFGLFLLALASLAPNAAYAVTCFWVGGTATWDTTNTGGGGAGGIKWASASGGGTTCAGSGTGGSPGAADNATFDASSGGGTVTVNATISITDFNMSAFTGTIDFATNNNNISLAGGSGAFTRTGSATNTLNMGSGTWTLSNNQGAWNAASATNWTLNRGTSTIAFTATGAGTRTFNGGTSQTYNIVSVAGNSANNNVSIAFATALTITTLSVTAPNRILFPNNQSVTITTFSNIAGSSSNQVLLASNNTAGSSNIATISSANNFTCDWCGVSNLTFSGGGTFAATNSFNLIGNTGITITPPSAGGGGGGRIIGG